MERDEIVTLPDGGTEITVEAAQGDLRRVCEALADRDEPYVVVMPEEADGYMADLERVSEFLGVLCERTPSDVPVEEFVPALRRVLLAQVPTSDSNDEEIEALSEALSLALGKLGVPWPSFPEEGVKYIDDSHPEEPVFAVVEVAQDGNLELDNGQWYELHGPEGFLAKLDAGIIRKVS